MPGSSHGPRSRSCVCLRIAPGAGAPGGALLHSMDPHPTARCGPVSAIGAREESSCKKGPARRGRLGRLGAAWGGLGRCWPFGHRREGEVGTRD
eukprot:6744404-Prymnesium_polylepis.2